MGKVSQSVGQCSRLVSHTGCNLMSLSALAPCLPRSLAATFGDVTKVCLTRSLAICFTRPFHAYRDNCIWPFYTFRYLHSLTSLGHFECHKTTMSSSAKQTRRQTEEGRGHRGMKCKRNAMAAMPKKTVVTRREIGNSLSSDGHRQWTSSYNDYLWRLAGNVIIHWHSNR